MGRARIASLILTGLLASTAALTTGCASSAKGLSQSSASKNFAPQTLNVEAPKGTPLAVIRYPAFVESGAQDAYHAAFIRASIGGYAGSGMSGGDADALADSIILKSNYFALSVFKELAAKLPEHGVLLSPHAITVDAQGNLTSKPMTQAESLPNVVTVDFASYTFPDAEKMMGKQPLTFGDIVTPIVSVNTDHRASTATHGLLLASDPILRRAAGNGQADAKDAITKLEKGQLEPQVSELDFIAYLRGAASVTVPSTAIGRSSSVSKSAQIYPLEKLRLDMNALSAKDGASAGDPLSSAFSKSFANRVVALINATDIDKATMAGRAAAIGQFDESLAALTLIGSDDADYLSRLRYAERLLEAEQKYLSVQSLRLFDGVYNGEMGAQMRDMLTSEYQVLEERRALARKQNAAVALAVFGAVAGGVAVANQDGQDTSYAERLAIEALIQGAIFAGTQAYSFSKQSGKIGENYLSSIVPALETQTSIQVDLIDSNETITAIRFEDLKAKLQTLYSNKQRSLDTVATRCAFNSPAAPQPGSWMGVCNGGQANGNGVGVLTLADGSVAEYYGYAEKGLAQGAGYQIIHGPSASAALEGNFDSGQANGIMRVSSPSGAQTLRVYAAGQDVGPAPIGQGFDSPFDREPKIVQNAAPAGAL